MSGYPDLEYGLINGTIVQVHQKATGAKAGLSIRPPGARAVGALGNLVRFLLLLDQAHDMKGVSPLIQGVSFGALLADTLHCMLVPECLSNLTADDVRPPLILNEVTPNLSRAKGLVTATTPFAPQGS